jgi:hypothetical protein
MVSCDNSKPQRSRLAVKVGALPLRVLRHGNRDHTKLNVLPHELGRRHAVFC